MKVEKSWGQVNAFKADIVDSIIRHDLNPREVIRGIASLLFTFFRHVKLDSVDAFGTDIFESAEKRGLTIQEALYGLVAALFVMSDQMEENDLEERDNGSN